MNKLHAKGEYFRELKSRGYEFEKHYRDYSFEEMQAAYLEFAGTTELPRQPRQPQTPRQPQPVGPRPIPEPPTPAPQPERMIRSNTSLDEMAGQRAYSNEQIVRVDDQGREWLQEEVTKPATPRPRARRKITYVDTGVKTQTAQIGDYVETFEVAGDRNVTSSVKITMPSYQVGIYRDPRLPFRVHIYNGERGFDLFDVQEFYGGADLVPDTIKRKYVANDLCYDMQSTIRAINEEYRQKFLRSQ